jgi:hypothetical protein
MLVRDVAGLLRDLGELLGTKRRNPRDLGGGAQT